MQLRRIQEKIAEALGAVEFISGRGIEPIAEDKGDVANILAAKIMQNGAAILVGSCRFEPESSASKITVGKATVIVQCIERFVENRARPGHATSLELAEAVHWSLNMLPVEGVGVLVSRSIVPSAIDQHTISHDVTIEVKTSLSDPFDN